MIWKPVRQKRKIYETGKIRTIDIRRITHDVNKPVDYIFKSLKRRSFSSDDVLVLNWGGSANLSPNLRAWKECCDCFKTARGAPIMEDARARAKLLKGPRDNWVR